jgi:hypothetical protein
MQANLVITKPTTKQRLNTILAVAQPALAIAGLPLLASPVFGAISLNLMTSGCSFGDEKSSDGLAPFGTKEAWSVSVTGTLDADKIARENGGRVHIFQIVPPRISNGTSEYQEISAQLSLTDRNGNVTEKGKVMKTSDGTEVLVVTASPDSGKVIYTLEGTVFNRHMASIENGGQSISPAEKLKYTSGYYAFDLKSEAIKRKLEELGLTRRAGERDSAFIQRACTWVVKNKVYASGAHGPNNESIFNIPELNCNGTTKALLTIFRTNNVAAKAKPSVLLYADGSTDQHNDVEVYVADQKKWMTIDGAALIGPYRKDAFQFGITERLAAFGQDINRGTNCIAIGAANDIGHFIDIKGMARYFSFCNEQNPTWSKEGTDGKVRGKVNFEYTHKVTPIDIRTLKIAKNPSSSD